MATSKLQGDMTPPELVSYLYTLDNQSIEGSNYGTFNINVERSGYYPLGIIGVYLRNATTNGTRVTYCSLMRWWIDDTTARIRIRNLASNAAVIKINVHVLYGKI